MGYVYQDYPKTLYRLTEGNQLEGRTFARAEDVEPGWGPIENFQTDHIGRPVARGESPKLYRELLSENARMLDTIKLLTDENAAKDRQIEALEKALRAAEAMNADPPEGEAKPDAPKPARRRKPRSEA